jgi:hypothetical protein
MAVPTSWGFTAVAGTTTTFPIDGEGANLYAVDLGGTLTPTLIPLATGLVVVSSAGATDAEIAAAMIAFAARAGVGHQGAGGYPVQGVLQLDAALTVTS